VIKVVLFCGSGRLARLIHSNLEDYCNFTAIVQEKQGSRWLLFKRRIKKIGFSKAFGQLAFVIVNKFLAKLDRTRIQQIVDRFDEKDRPFPKATLFAVNSINDEEVEKIVAEQKPDLILVSGTRILSKKLISSVNCPIVNTHVGITPKYRGVHGGYWALRNNDIENFGVTVHLVDPGIDTGGILYQDTTKPGPRDTINTYPYLQIELAIPLLRQVISDLENNKLKVLQPRLASNLYHHPTLVEYLFHRLFRGVG
jgi:folate-dependent phosphoribosylglycinamide formyltransferase PurN